MTIALQTEQEHQTLEQRVAYLEAELTRIIELLPKAEELPIAEAPSPQPEVNWIDRLAGSISNEPLFLEVLEYGRRYRQEN